MRSPPHWSRSRAWPSRGGVDDPLVQDEGGASAHGLVLVADDEVDAGGREGIGEGVLARKRDNLVPQGQERPHDAARDDDHIGIVAIHNVGEAGAERTRGLVDDRASSRVSRGRRFEHHPGGDRRRLVVPTRRGPNYRGGPPLCFLGDIRAAYVCGQASPRAAGAPPAVEGDRHVAELTGMPALSPDEPAVQDERASDPGTDGEDGERARAPSVSPDPLAEGDRVHVVVDEYGNPRLDGETRGDGNAAQFREEMDAFPECTGVGIHHSGETDADGFDRDALLLSTGDLLTDEAEQGVEYRPWTVAVG